MCCLSSNVCCQPGRRSRNPGAFLVAFCLFALLWISPRVAIAHTHGGYSHDSTIGYTDDNWMSGLPDSRRFSELSIPGTHDSGAYVFGGDAVETQTMDLATQLRSGIRAWDIRLGYAEPLLCLGGLMVYHGVAPQWVSFSEVLETAQTFLSQHPDEAIFMRIRHETGCSIGFDYRVSEAFAQFPGLRYTGTDDNPTLGSLRGKVLVLQDFEGQDRGVPWSTFDIQDDYDLDSNWDLYSKWEKVRGQFYRSSNGNPNSVYVNFLSGSGGSFPYFVASGHSSPGTSAPRLSTGLTTPGWSGSYPDFPRVDCFIGICTIAFEGTNVLATDRMQLGWWSHGGIVMADFPGAGLVASVIRLNEKVIVYEAESSPVIYHHVGRAEGDGWGARVADDGAGHLAFGPYATHFGEGERTAVFRARIGSAAPSTPVAYIDVWDASALELLAQKTFHASDFPGPDVYENLYLNFDLAGRSGHQIETRVWWLDQVDMHLDLIQVLEPPFLIRAYDAESDPEMHHAVGRADGDGWSADPASDGAGTLIYGPYASYLGSGDKSATFRARADTTSQVGVLYLDVWDATTSETLASRGVDTTDFAGHLVDTDFTLSFDLDGREGHQIETRAWWYGQTYAKVDFVRIDQE